MKIIPLRLQGLKIKPILKTFMACAGLFLLWALWPASESRAKIIDNDWLALDIQDNWEVSPGSSALKGAALSLVLRDKNGECSINIDIAPYAGNAGQLVRLIREEQRAAKIVAGEIEEKDGVFFYRVKKGNIGGLVYIGGNGQYASMVTIYGLRKMIAPARKMLSEARMKRDLTIYPSE